MDARDWRRLATAVRSGLRGVRATPLVFASSVCTMAAGLIVLGAYLLLVHNMRTVVERFGADFRVVAFVERELPAERVEALRSELARLEGVESVRWVSPDEALGRLRADFGADADVLDGLGRNPLPGSLEIELAPAARSPGAVGARAARAGGRPGVSDVRWVSGWVETYARLLRTLEWIGAGLALFLLLVLGAIVAGTVRLALHARADEIEIQRLVGAGGAFLRLPFYLEGAFQGGTAAGVAVAALWGLYRIAVPLFGDSLEFLLGRAEPVFFGPLEIALLVVTGMALGVGGAVVSLLRLGEPAA
jgi:cell division transport system permease protein